LIRPVKGSKQYVNFIDYFDSLFESVASTNAIGPKNDLNALKNDY
jgi:hypothetical protein